MAGDIVYVNMGVRPDFEPAEGEKISKEVDISSGDGSRIPDDKTITGPENTVAETSDAGSGEKEKIESFIQKVTKDGVLTGRELDVLREYLKGKTRTEISEALFISESTVKNHISSIFAKTGVKSKKELMALVENPGKRTGFMDEISENIKKL